MHEILTTILNWLGVESGFTLKYVGLRGGLPLWALFILICLGLALAVGLYSMESAITRGRRIMLAVLRAIVYSLLLFFLLFEVFGFYALKPDIVNIKRKPFGPGDI